MSFDYKIRIADAFTQRKRKNPSLSLRSFARYLGVSPTSLSQVMSGFRNFSKKNALKIASKLNFSNQQIQQMLFQIGALSIHQNISSPEHEILDEDKFQLISHWFYFAILNLAKINNASPDPLWISKRLGISELEAKNAISRLVRLNLLKIENGKLSRISKSLDIEYEGPSSAIRNYHKEIISKAESSIEEIPFADRDLSAITMTINTNKIPDIRKMIAEFQHQMANFLEQEQGNEVYTFSTQFFPLTIKENKNEKKE